MFCGNESSAGFFYVTSANTANHRLYVARQRYNDGRPRPSRRELLCDDEHRYGSRVWWSDSHSGAVYACSVVVDPHV